MRYRPLVNSLAILVGVSLVTMGALLLVMAVFADVRQGRVGLGVSGTAFLLVAAPLLTAPFSVRAAKYLLLLAMACFAALAIRLAFWPQAGVTPTPLVQGAVIMFTALLVARVYLSRRDKRLGNGG